MVREVVFRLSLTNPQAQDLGLHRESTMRAQTAQDLAYVELRRRVWASCVIFDRWYGAALGIPLLVDLLDCDVLLPAPYEIIPDAEPTTWPIDVSFMALSEHLKLSILIGRVLKTIYSPTGLKHATDGQLESLQSDMEGWMTALPVELRYKGVRSSHAAGEFSCTRGSIRMLTTRPTSPRSLCPSILVLASLHAHNIYMSHAPHFRSRDFSVDQIDRMEPRVHSVVARE